MRRISSHEPRYKHSTQGRKIRHADSRELSQSSSSEEEDESTDSEESETSSENESPQGGSFPSVADINKRGTVKKTSRPETFMHTRIDGTKILMLDKVTQKNLLSPFPSFTLPPVYKEIVRPGIQRIPDTRRFVETDRKYSGKSSKTHAKRKESQIEEDESSGSIHKHSDRTHRRSRDRGHHHSKGRQSERVLSYVSGCEVKDTSRRVLKPPPEPEGHSKPTEQVLTPRKRKTIRDPDKSVENREEQRKSVRSAGSSVNDSAVRSSQKHIKAEGKGKCCEGGGGEVREKLVYVLEEKGKERRKVETDLFTLNEILTIKKDLLELSEFAKKLKRMKEMAREPENGQNQQSYCHCKPASELLSDVNRRIEALEARQEELEKGGRPGCRGDVEMLSKKETEVKMFSECQSNTAEMPKQSALSTAPSFHRTEMILPRADGFSNNSDIVNELMDIKTQLQKLEKRRMTGKDVSETPECTDLMKQAKLDDRGIAVYSSKTYILTDNLKKVDEARPEVKPEIKPEIKPETEKEANKSTEVNSNRTKGDVENWLRNVSPNHVENITVCEMIKGPKSRGHSQKESQHADLKRKDCSTTSKNENFENQEQPKNRATGKDGKAAESGVIDFAENVTPGGRCSKHLQYKECIVTPSGKIFARITKSKTQPLKEIPVESTQTRPQRPQSAKCRSPEPIRPTGSCSSIPSIPKEGQRRLQDQPKVMKSKSVHELSGGSSVSKFEKTARNTSLKHSNKADHSKVRGKRHKEDKNELVKRLESHKKALYRTPVKPLKTSSSHSEFLASMSLDAAANSPGLDSSGFLLSSDKKEIILSYTATNEDHDHLDRSSCCSAYLEAESAKKSCKEERKRMKKKESELKKILKKQIKEYQRQKKKLKKEQKRRETELLNDFKCEKYKCLRKCKTDYEAKKQALLKDTRGKSILQYKVKEIDEEEEQEPPVEVQKEAKEIQCKRDDSITPDSMDSADFPNVGKSDSLEIYKKALKKTILEYDNAKQANECEDRRPMRLEAVCEDRRPMRLEAVCDDRRPMRLAAVCEDKRPPRQTCDRRPKRGSEQVDKRWLQNFMRNLDLVYPRFCALSSPTNCHHERKKKFDETCSWRSLCGKHSSRIRKCDRNDEYAETPESDCSDHVNRKYDHNYFDFNQQPRPEHYPCRCMRVFMQTRMQNGWSGLKPHQKSSTDTTSDLTRSRSAPTCESNRRSYVTSGPKSQICLTAHETKKEKCKQKKTGNHKKEKEKKKTKKCECRSDSICKCRRCGNLHNKEGHSDSDRKSHAGSEKSKKSKKRIPTCGFTNRRNGDIFPMFSFLSHFCKPKPQDKKFSLKKLAEVPHLKACSTPRKKRSEHSRKHHKDKHKSKEHMCVENSSTSECRKKKKKDKKKKKKSADKQCSCEKYEKEHKKKKHKKACCENESDTAGSKKEKKHKKKHNGKSKEKSEEESEKHKEEKKKKKKKKKKHYDSEGNCDLELVPDILACYQTMYPSNSKSCETVTSDTTESSESSTSEDNRCSFESKLQQPRQKNRHLKDRLSSFHSFWKNFRKTKQIKPPPETNHKTERLLKKMKQIESSDSSFINDCSRSSEIPRSKQVVEMKAEPTSFIKIRKKRQKLSKDEKKSIKESKKESHMPKSKSARRRHI